MRQVTIYSLKHPLTEEVRYIGQTRREYRRRCEHNSKRTALKYPKDRWVSKLRRDNLRPVFEVIDVVDEIVADSTEQQVILFFKSVGAQLLNLTLGGDSMHLSKNHNSISAKGKTIDEIYGKEKADTIRFKMSESTKGVNNPNYGKTFSEEFCLKNRMSQKNKSLSVFNREGQLVGVFFNSNDAAKFVGCLSSKIRFYKKHGWFVNRTYLIKDTLLTENDL